MTAHAYGACWWTQTWPGSAGRFPTRGQAADGGLMPQAVRVAAEPAHVALVPVLAQVLVWPLLVLGTSGLLALRLGV